MNTRRNKYTTERKNIKIKKDNYFDSEREVFFYFTVSCVIRHITQNTRHIEHRMTNHNFPIVVY